MRTYVIAALLLAASGCSKSNFEGQVTHERVQAIARKIGVDNIRALTVKVTAKQVTVRAQNPKKPTKVQHWWFFKGKARGPRKVILLGGSLEASLWPLSSVDFTKVGSIVERAEQMWGKKVRKMEVRIPKFARWGNKLRWTVWFEGGSFTYATPDGATVNPPMKRRRRK
ncbi:MAG: hypothetical protein KC503_27385 [Myxococcales bacterium]|nr:hypothetical protein [Myxococcales bacterium]